MEPITVKGITPGRLVRLFRITRGRILSRPIMGAGDGSKKGNGDWREKDRGEGGNFSGNLSELAALCSANTGGFMG
jgi:hypothetical protein